MKIQEKNAIKAQEARKMPIYSEKLDMQFNSISEAATYLKTHYFENATFECLKTSIRLLLTNKVTKSKFDFGWSNINE